MARFTPAAVLLLGAAAPAVAAPPTAARVAPPSNFTIVVPPSNFTIAAAPDPPTALPQRATADDLRWQPSLDFDTDGCYNVPAIDAEGNVAEGLPYEWVGLSSDCRDESDLDNNNVYSRQRCNSGWCVYLYGYYFEKDVPVANFFGGGHRHDWEHIAVWVSTETGRAEYVGASQHGNYELKPAADVRWDGDHPKIVYHKDGASTHCFRFAGEADENIENHKGVWVSFQSQGGELTSLVLWLFEKLQQIAAQRFPLPRAGLLSISVLWMGMADLCCSSAAPWYRTTASHRPKLGTNCLPTTSARRQLISRMLLSLGPSRRRSRMGSRSM